MHICNMRFEQRDLVKQLNQAKQLARNIEVAQKEQARNKATAALSGISRHPNDASSNTLSH